MLNLEVRFTYADVNTAESILAAVSPENGEYVNADLEGSTLIFTMQADNAGTLRNTADDLMACIKVAEESVGLISHTDESDE